MSEKMTVQEAAYRAELTLKELLAAEYSRGKAEERDRIWDILKNKSNLHKDAISFLEPIIFGGGDE